MLVKYIGSRPSVSTVLSGRLKCYFGPENDYIIDVESPEHVNELMRSSQHRYTMVAERPKTVKVEVKEVEKPVVKKVKKARKGKK